MEIRRLEPNEWGVLDRFPDGFKPDPGNSIAVVALNKDGKPVGRMTLVVMPHLEGTYIDLDERGGFLGYRLQKAIEKEARNLGVKKYFAYCEPEHGQYLERLGYKKLNLEVWEKDV